MKPPSILIVIGHRNLTAYLILPDDLPETIETVDYENDGQTSVPLIDWSDGRTCYQVVIQQIKRILERYQPETWGLAGNADLIAPMCDVLPSEIGANLAIVRYIDAENVLLSNVCSVFGPALKNSSAQKEHCL